MLCCTALHCFLLLLCCAAFCCAVLCCVVVLCCAVLCSAVLYHALWCVNTMFIYPYDPTRFACPANQHPKSTIIIKSPRTFAHLVNFAKKCVCHVFVILTVEPAIAVCHVPTGRDSRVRLRTSLATMAGRSRKIQDGCLLCI